MTPYELNIYAEAYFNKQKQDFKEKLSLEYYNAKWTIQWLGKNKPKPLKEILKEILNEIDTKQEKKVMSDTDMLNQVKMLNSLFGGEVKEI